MSEKQNRDEFEKGKHFLSIRAKLVLTFLPLSVAILISLSFFVSRAIKSEVKDEFNTATKRSVKQVNHTLNLYLESFYENCRYLASHPTVKKADHTLTSYVDKEETVMMTPSKNGGIEEEIYRLYERFAKKHPRYAYIYMATTDGGYVQWPERECKAHYNPKKRPYYQPAMDNPGKISLTRSYYSEADGGTIVSIVTTVHGKDGKIIGVQGIDVSLKGLTDLVKDMRINKTGYVVLTDSKGKIIAHPRRPEYNFKNFTALDLGPLEDFLNSPGEYREVKIGEELFYANSYISPKTGWKYVAFVPYREIMSLFQKVNFVIWSNLAAFVLILIPLIFRFSSSLTRPIRALADVMSNMRQGDLDVRADVSQSGEIGELARTFNTMSDRLKDMYVRLERKVFEISTLYDISSKISFVNDIKALVQIILNQAVESVEGERGILFVYNSEEDTLEFFSTEGYRREMKIPDSLRENSGVAWKVFEEKEPVVINDVADSELFRSENWPDTGEPTRSLMCVPLAAKDQINGVLAIIDKKGEEGFDDDDLNLLSAISTQAAIAIENTRLYELSITDGMTKLFIHRYFQLRLDEEIKRAKRYDTSLSLILFDIDHFKNFNDTYGHQTGDEVLIEVAGVIKSFVRSGSDLAARYGGEEFAIVLPETEAEKAKKMAERLREKIAALEVPGPEGESLSVTVSLGVAEFPRHGEDKDSLIKKADIALYQCKEEGRNCSRVYSPEMEEGSP